MLIYSTHVCHLSRWIATDYYYFLFLKIDFRWWTKRIWRRVWHHHLNRKRETERKERNRRQAAKTNNNKNGERNTNERWRHCSHWPNKIENFQWCTCHDCRPPRQRPPVLRPKKVNRQDWNVVPPSSKWSNPAAAQIWKVTSSNSTVTAISIRESTNIRADRTFSISRAVSSRNFYVHFHAASSSFRSPTPSSLIIRPVTNGDSTTFASAMDAHVRFNRRRNNSQMKEKNGAKFGISNPTNLLWAMTRAPPPNLSVYCFYSIVITEEMLEFLNDVIHYLVAGDSSREQKRLALHTHYRSKEIGILLICFFLRGKMWIRYKFQNVILSKKKKKMPDAQPSYILCTLLYPM